MYKAAVEVFIAKHTVTFMASVPAKLQIRCTIGFNGLFLTQKFVLN